MRDITSYRIKRPTSAYVVLGRVIELIREEHRRLRMGIVFSRDELGFLSSEENPRVAPWGVSQDGPDTSQG